MLMIEYYTKKTDENGNITFELVNEDNIKILGKSLNEVITILQGLEFERITQIKMTMENLKLLYEKTIDILSKI